MSLGPAPGSLSWLLLWDARLVLREFTFGRAPWISVALWGGFALVFHMVSWLATVPGRAMPEAARLQLYVQLGGLIAALMLVGAVFAAFRMLFVGRDLALHLGAPLPFARVVAARVLAMVVSEWLLLGVFVFPSANVAALYGRPEMLLVYPMLLGLAAFATALALLLIVALVRALGAATARRALQWVQITLALLFVLPYLLRGRSGFWLLSGQLSLALGWPARALLGEPLPLLAWMSGAAALLAFSIAVAAAPLKQVLLGAEPGQALTAAARAHRFRSGLLPGIALKEWRTILREPQLLGQLLFSAVAMVPICLSLVIRNGQDLPGLAASLVLMAAQLAQTLSRLAISAEEAPSLLGAAPVARSRLMMAKCLAVLAPLWAICLLSSAWLAWRDPLAAASAFLCAVAASFSAFAIEVCRPFPLSRRSYLRPRQVRRRDPLDVLSILAMMAGWAWAAHFLAAHNPWGAAVVLAVILVPMWQWWREASPRSVLGY